MSSRNRFLSENEVKNNEEEVLREWGLSKNEVKVFMAVLKLGPSSVGRITEKSEIHRRNVYDALERLAERGLVGSVIKNNVKFFEVADPTMLLDIIKSEKEKISEMETKLQLILPKLLTIKNLGFEKEDVRIYIGAESRRIVFEDIIRSSKANLVLGGHTPSKLTKIYLMKWHKRRIRAGVRDRMIFCQPTKWSRELARMPLTEVRYLPKEINTKSVINIYDKKVAILLWSKEKQVSIVIDNKNVAEDFREYFNFLWKISKS